MSPAPRCRTLSTLAFVVATMLLLVTAASGISAVGASTPGSTGNVIGWIVSTVGVFAAGAILCVAGRALFRSFRAARETAAGHVLDARASAAASRSDSLATFGYGMALLIGLLGAVMMTARNGVIQTTFLQWDIIAESAPDVVTAFRQNLMIAVAAEVLVLVTGLLLAIARLVPGPAGRPVRAIAVAYIDGMRAVPAIIVIYLVGFGLPLLELPVLSDMKPVWFAVVALTLTYSAYVAETYRAGIELIHPSQWAASRSVGFSYLQTLRYVVLPQAVRGVIPPLLSAFIALQKDTALVSVIGTLDAFNQAKFYSSSSFNLSPVTLVAVLFIIITIPQTRLVDWLLERSASRRRRAGVN